MLKTGQMKEALALASKKENKGSHLARITAAGIPEFIEGKEAGHLLGTAGRDGDARLRPGRDPCTTRS